LKKAQYDDQLMPQIVFKMYCDSWNVGWS